MNKIIIIILSYIMLFCGIRYYRNEVIRQREISKNYQDQTKTLQSKIKDIYYEKIKLEQENSALEEAAATDKVIFDWHKDISHTAVIKRLQQK
ncbi:MAG: hypothetical protein J6W96_05910 [Alphaproteobacteria bacterium]|nr:hypothetical protein [Alphaproteobacteria bacterium]